MSECILYCIVLFILDMYLKCNYYIAICNVCKLLVFIYFIYVHIFY